MMATPRVAFGATPLEGVQQLRPVLSLSKGGFAVFWAGFPSPLPRFL